MKYRTQGFLGGLCVLAMLFLLPAGCAGRDAGSSGGEDQSSTTSSLTAEQVSADYEAEDTDDSWDAASATLIELKGTSITVTGRGAVASGSTVTITAAGVFLLSGTLEDGQVVIDADKEDTVRLVLNGADIRCSTSAAIYAKQAKKTILTLAEGTVNTVADGEAYTYADEAAQEPDAAIFCKDDLTINGTGSLSVTAVFHNGIGTKDDLIIAGGNLSVQAANDGLRGRDSVAIKDGTLVIDAQADGIQSNNDEDAAKGFVVVDGGELNITAGYDGIQAETVLQLNGGSLVIRTGGGSQNSSTDQNGEQRPGWGQWGDPFGSSGTSDDTPSAKGIKAGSGLYITGGDLEIDSSDDAVHTNGSAVISGGILALSSGDDGIHADAALTIEAGEVSISKSYEGLEGASITVNGGTIRLTASDDGLNAAGGNDSSSLGGRPGQNEFTANSAYFIRITGGYLAISASGDGIDSNGDLTITGGTVIVNGPTNDGNGALDYAGSCTISGGILVTAGSAGMAQAPGSSSPQNSLAVTYSSSQSGGTAITLTDEAGNPVLTFVPEKTYRHIVISVPSLTQGESYTLYTGGTPEGEGSDGLYTGTAAAGAEKLTDVTLSGAVTSISDSGNAVNGGMNGGPGGNMPGGDHGGQQPPGGRF